MAIQNSQIKQTLSVFVFKKKKKRQKKPSLQNISAEQLTAFISRTFKQAKESKAHILYVNQIYLNNMYYL